MNSDTPLDEQLLAALLARTVPARPTQPAEHPDEELLALFAMGALPAAQRSLMIEHLAACAPCRELASTVLSLPSPAEQQALTRQPILPRGTRRVWAPIALAASLLLAVSVVFVSRSRDPILAERRAYEHASRLLAAGEFDRVRRLAADAKQRGVQSHRLENLESQAIRRMPGPIALALAGRLTDFGYEPGGVVARATTAGPNESALNQALALLDGPSSDQRTGRLNRGHALLALDRPHEAAGEFQRVADQSPREPLAWLGLGLAQFMLDDFAAAERSFRESLRLDGSNLSAKWNLAMTLEELGEFREALGHWEQLLDQRWPEPERRKLEAAVQQLRRQQKED